MIAMSHGLSLSLPEARIIISSFDAFSYRSIDQLNSLSLGDGSVVIIGDIAGITNSKKWSNTSSAKSAWRNTWYSQCNTIRTCRCK